MLEQQKMMIESTNFDVGVISSIKAGKDAICSFAEGDELRMMLMGIKRFTKVEPLNTKMTRQRIAQKMIDENKYCF